MTRFAAEARVTCHLYSFIAYFIYRPLRCSGPILHTHTHLQRVPRAGESTFLSIDIDMAASSLSPVSMFPLDPLLREAAMWFGVGGAVAAFVAGIVLVLAALVGAGTVARLVRAVGVRLDKLAGYDEVPTVSQPGHYRRGSSQLYSC